jgi:hypothetical protein
MKNLLYTSIIAGLLATSCTWGDSEQRLRRFNPPEETAPDRSHEPRLLYHNTQYDFTFFLPTNWQGYSVLVQQWSGQTYLPAADKEVEVDHGPVIVLRNPQWKTDDPWQDIPILVFTRKQWKASQQGQFSIYVDGLEFEIAHNSKYVFAIWNRFNGDESVKGFREAEGIVMKNQAAHGLHLNPE